MVRFEWDPRKAEANQRAHGVSFAEAVTALEDAFALTQEDPEDQRELMKKVVAERYRNIDFSRAKRGSVIKPAPGKTKISIRLDNIVLEYFRNLVDKAGAGNYQTLINDALLEHVHRRSTLDVVRQVVRDELAAYGAARGANATLRRTRAARRRA